MALITLLAAAAFSAQPAKLLLGRDAGADLTLSVTGDAKVAFSTSVGTVGDATHDAAGWHTRFTPPALRSPSVALVLAQVDQEGDRELYWLSIPLTGADTMEIETRPGSKVEALVAGERIGPITADSSGTARLAMVVPPGVEKGTLRITDKLGNVAEKPLDLEPPPFSRLRMAARGAAASSAAPLEVEIFVVRPDGTPDDKARVDLRSDDEGETEIIKHLGSGAYLARYLPPDGKTSGSARLEAKANGQLASLDATVLPPNVKLAQPFWQSSLVSERPWSVSAGVIGGLGQSYDGSALGSLGLETAVRLEVLPIEALLDIGGALFGDVDQGAAQGTTTASSIRTWLLQLGVRASRRLVRGFDGHLTAFVGAENQHAHVSNVLNSVSTDQSVWLARAGFAVGANLRLGPGRALAQVSFDFSPSNEAGLEGSLGGVQLQVGYLVTLR
jgi:hypothetical protein